MYPLSWGYIKTIIAFNGGKAIFDNPDKNECTAITHAFKILQKELFFINIF
jgi:hypothetical protein